MIRYFVQRPVAILVSLLVLVLLGLYLFPKIPVSLLPEASVPEILVKVHYPNIPSAQLETEVVKSLRDRFALLSHVTNVESTARNHSALIRIRFVYGTSMDMAFIAVNEKIDELSSLFPRDMPRPQVSRISTSDIPVLRLQVIPKENQSLGAASGFTQTILRKRLERLPGVSIVDISGSQEMITEVIPDQSALASHRMTSADLLHAIQEANQGMENLSVKDGQYTYFLRFSRPEASPSAIGNLMVRSADDLLLPLHTLAAVRERVSDPQGFHLFNGETCLVMTVQKHPEARMTALTESLEKEISVFQKEYPAYKFVITRNQAFLMDAGIDNLKQDILYGGILTMVLLFLFLGNWVSPTIMCLSIPLSFILTFIFFYLFGITFNIISLSGLALGLGMLIDNSIVVIDNVSRLHRLGYTPEESAVRGTTEVTIPVISQVLTTVAVYAPLVIISGFAGVLIGDQSLALSISLFISVCVAFFLAPLLYKQFYSWQPKLGKEDTRLYLLVSKIYHRLIDHVLQHRRLYVILMILLFPCGFLLYRSIGTESLPKMEQLESLVKIDWNEPLQATENLRRTREIQQRILPRCKLTEAESGLRQFLLQQDQGMIQETELYYACTSERERAAVDSFLAKILQQQYPAARFFMEPAKNAFTQLFTSSQPPLELRFSLAENNGKFDVKKFEKMLSFLPDQSFARGEGVEEEQAFAIHFDREKMALYGIPLRSVETVLKQLYGTLLITEMKVFGSVKQIVLGSGTSGHEQLRTTVQGRSGVYYPLASFISFLPIQLPKSVTADKNGPYYSLIYQTTPENIEAFQQSVRPIAARHGFTVSFHGSYFDGVDLVHRLGLVFVIVLLLTFVILAFQYESFLLPLLVMLAIPIGITAGLFALWISGYTLNVMSGIGFIVILGLIVDDPILKIATLNRLHKEALASGVSMDEAYLKKMVHQAGSICLKPLLMVSLTTSAALLPILFSGGIGNDLQKPMACVIIGGLTAGTFFTTLFIPLAYWYAHKFIKPSYEKTITDPRNALG
ncbi:MAG: efflux RND transporter permease subunit [Chitinophagaceae bacterium]